MKLRGLLDQISNDGLRQTYSVMVLFDDSIDAENTLNSLRRAKLSPAEISVIFRERVLDLEARTPYRALLSDVVAKSALDIVGSWLQGLASLILPDRATYLAAGPIGAILATLRDTRQIPDETDGDTNPIRQLPTRQLTHTFQAFGFERDEAAYVEQRVVAGSPLIAVTSENVTTLRVAHETFSMNQPVYIGLTRTEAAIASQASRLLMTGPRGTGAVVIADAASPLIHLVNEPSLFRGPRDLRSRNVTSQYGEIIGRVEDILFETDPDYAPPELIHDNVSDRSLLLRYLVVRVGRGLGRQRLAIPSERITFSTEGVIVAVTHEELISAPRYDTDIQLSRQEEASIRRHFNESYYWITPADEEKATSR